MNCIRHSSRLVGRSTAVALACLCLNAACDLSIFGAPPTGNPLPIITGADPDVDTGSSVGTPQNSPEATQLEQLALERVNRARLRPGAEAAAGGIAIDEGVPGELDATPKPPVAMNALLRAAAREHAQDMLDRDYFAHRTPEGKSPGDRVLDTGYTWITVGENLAWNGTTGSLDDVDTVEMQHDNLFVDQGVEGRGHRITMLFADLREVGISIVKGEFRATDGIVYTDSLMQAQEYATSSANETFILGVVYDDLNGNGEYDAGEGRAGAIVRFGDTAHRTNAAGGYSFSVSTPGTQTLSFASGQQIALDIAEGDSNIKVDLVDGNRIVLNLGVGRLR